MTISEGRDLLRQKAHFSRVRSTGEPDSFTQQNSRRSRQGVWGRLFHGKIGGQWSVEILSAAGSNDQPSVCFASRAAFVSYLVQILVCPSRISYRGCVFHTCVPGNNSFALLIMMLVQEERRSSAMVSPPLPIMWPDTLLGDDDTVRLSLHIGGVGTLGLASSGVCPCPLQDASLHCFHCPSHCRGGNTALPWIYQG